MHSDRTTPRPDTSAPLRAAFASAVFVSVVLVAVVLATVVPPVAGAGAVGTAAGGVSAPLPASETVDLPGSAGDETPVGDNGTDERDTDNGTVDVYITFENFSARETASFGGNVTITGGRDVGLVPVLYARSDASEIPAIEARAGVKAVGIDRQIRLPQPSSGVSPSRRSTAATTNQTVPWGLRRIAARNLTDRVGRAALRNVTVAVVDTGIDYTHPDIGDSVVWGANFTDGSERYGRETAADNNGHGTAVAGIVAARDNDRATVGVAPGVRLYSVKVLRGDRTGRIRTLISGLDAAVAGPDGVVGTDDDADVVQVSAGTAVADEQLANVVDAASEHAVVVAAAGNYGDGSADTDEVRYPAKYDGVVAVAATGRDDRTTGYSSEGPAVDIAAPGQRIPTLSPDAGTTYFSGTSAAAPHVSGVVALLLAAENGTGDAQMPGSVRDILKATARDIEAPGDDQFSGAGLVQADAAVATAVGLDANRTVSETAVPSNRTVTVTVETTVIAPRVTVSESFSRPFGAGAITSVTVDGDATEPVLEAANDRGVVVIVGGLRVGQTVTVSYEVRLPADADPGNTYPITGTVTNGEAEDTLPRVDLTVREQSGSGPLATYDADGDGAIDIGELGVAASDYASGDIPITSLATVAAVYASTPPAGN